jgi:hypothetical protein
VLPVKSATPPVKSARWVRRAGYGVVAWAIPYATSLALLPLLRTDPALFKTIMIVEGSFVGAALAVSYFDSVHDDYFREGVILGTTWIGVSWVLDFAGVVPFAGLTVARYFLEIGFEYLAMFAPTVAIGYVLQKNRG